MKKAKIFVPIFLSMLLIFSYVSPLVATSESISTKVLRLHILANSDTDKDQELKLKVRDFIIENCDVFDNCNNVDDAIASAKENKNKINALANYALKDLGSNYTANVDVCYEYFDTRVYEDITLPAGYYNSLKITIGQGKGHNWWCVIFPSVCISACSEDELDKYLDKDEIDLVENKNSYYVKFKSVEIYEKIKDKLNK